MGALPGRSLLKTTPPASDRAPGQGPFPGDVARWLDVEQWRRRPRRSLALRQPGQRALVLGSAQKPEAVDGARASASVTTVLRRRSGGGAVLLGLGDPLWVDAWVPRSDPLFHDDVVVASFWVGDWWARALTALGVPEVHVQRGPSVADQWARAACFAGRGPGEVMVAGRKLVGVAQWRGREGALFQSCAYRHLDAPGLADLLALSVPERQLLGRVLGERAGGLAELATIPEPALEDLGEALLDELPPGPAWQHLTS